MRFTEAIVALAALASHATAYEAEDGAEVTWAQVDTGLKRWRHGATEMKRTIHKFGGNVSDEIENAIAMAKTSGTVKNKPEALDAVYLTPSHFGTPGQLRHMNIDTGSADIWVYSTLQPKRQSAGHPKYNPAKSKTSKATNDRFQILYGDGSRAQGPVYLDKVSLAGVTVKHQGIGAASKVSGLFLNDKQDDGIFGFAFSKINTAGVKTWFQNAKLKKDVLGVSLKHNKPGFYDVGHVNKAHYSGKIHYTPITRRNGFWEFSIGHVKYGGKTKKVHIDAIADTGTSIALLPDAAIRGYYNSIPTAHYEPEVAGYIYACSRTPPDYSFMIAGSKRTIPGKLITFQEVGTINGKPYCLGGLQRNTGLAGMSILGDTFLKSQYVVFDAGRNRIGFANK